jgi:allantoate deiminase/N-carbamoyl-L-amino-acid hydrolase
VTATTPTRTPAAADAGRLSADIDTFAAITESGSGVTRLAFTPLEREAHRVFASRMRELGLTVHADAAGNTIAELAPTSPDTVRGAVGTGSHLDSVPSGGRFDGIAGVVAAMEVARLVVAENIPRQRPWRFVAFAAEEGARFGQACNGSRMAAGLTSEADVLALADADGISMHKAMRDVGLNPAELSGSLWKSEDWRGFVELHVEQGSVLEEAVAPVGIVDTISGSTRLRVTVDGVASHTGATPMHDRHDALVTASQCVLAGDEIARDAAHHGTRVTVGRLDVSPGAITTIPGRVVFSVDVRDIDSDRQRTTAEELADTYAAIAARWGTRLSVTVLADTSPVVLPADIRLKIAQAAADVGLSYRLLPSGASHDAQQINRITPTGMIFVPSAGGLSHVPDEHTEATDLAHGVDVLLATMYRLDSDR